MILSLEQTKILNNIFKKGIENIVFNCINKFSVSNKTLGISKCFTNLCIDNINNAIKLAIYKNVIKKDII